MKSMIRFLVSILVVSAFVVNALPCGPGYVSPLFAYPNKPENPYENFAAGKLGIVKPGFHRSVLFAAYRYINGGGFTPDEQKALVEVWKADFDNTDYLNDDIDEAVKAWVEKRQEIVGKEEKTPDIYVERTYGGYDFFPNCTKNAFEVAAETLSSRSSSHGSDSKDVKNWLEAQDKVFQNCASGKQTPETPNPGMPEWLQKDRAYQIAAAEFYSLNYEDAKKRFAEIAQDTDSPWQETADYLVARTLIRQASLSKTDEKAAPFYAEAEEHLQKFSSRGGKFSDSAERLLGLIKYRLHPEERVRELARKLLQQGGNENFRQDVIDYTWLMDKFEKEVLEAEEKRKEAEKPKDSNVNIGLNQPASNWANTVNSPTEKKNEDDLEINLYLTDYSRSWTFYVRSGATDDEAIAEAEKVVGSPLSDEMKKRVREARQNAYSARFSENRQPGHPGGYYGNEETSLSILPDFLRQEDLTDWLFTYQIENTEAYLYSLSKYRQIGSDLWLMTALSKADKNSTELGRLIEAANRTSRVAPAYPTVAFHTARIYIEQGKNADAKKLLDEILSRPDDLPISSVNQFLELRLKLAETLDEFLKYSLRKPFAFDFDGSAGTIEEFIAEQKTWYNPEYETQTKEEYERGIEERFREERLWQDRSMFDAGTIEVINEHFPLSVLMEAQKSPALPDYLRERFVMAIFTRALLLEDHATVQKIAPEVLKYHPEFTELLNASLNAKTPAGRQNALLFFILKNPALSPYMEEGMGKTDNEFGQFDSNDWWCAPYDTEYDEALGDSVPKKLSSKPVFLTDLLSRTAQAERKKLKDIGDAPKFLAGKVMAWAKRSPSDRRIPESLFIVYEANGWTKYGCGSNTELHDEIGAFMKRRYPNSEWTRKMLSSEEQQ